MEIGLVSLAQKIRFPGWRDVMSLQPMAAAEKLGTAQAICGVTVTGCRDFEGSIDFRRDLDTESIYASVRDRNRVCLIGCDIRGIWNELQ